MTTDPKVIAAAKYIQKNLTREFGDLPHEDEWEELLPVVAKAIEETDKAAWRPISEAPKDGTEILTWGTLHEDQICETHHLQVSWWDERGVWNSHLWGSHAPTHFRYIEPPQGEDDD